jgi:hypothetical protein
MAEAAIWREEIPAEAFASLAQAFSPDQIRPQSLVAYWPLIGRDTVAKEIRNGKNGTINGSVPQADHPRIYQ